MERSLIGEISSKINANIISWLPLSGGDISEAYILTTSSEKIICKVNRSPNSIEMFRAEKVGLEEIANSRTIATPKVYHVGSFEHSAFLLMEYIESKNPSHQDFKRFGQELAALHRVESSRFGFDNDNYIGNLHQLNKQDKDWISFYYNQRLTPQFELGVKNGYFTYDSYPTLNDFRSFGRNLFPNINPSLLHGDLWSGNYLISKKGIPYLIDPAVYYGHHEVDIAMSRLFGGFDPAFYEAYEESFPHERNYEARKDLYQLYYLLVHMNLFGRSYSAGVNRILKRYFPSNQ